jgi:hypothetical protein
MSGEESISERLLDLQPYRMYSEAYNAKPPLTIPIDLIAESARLDEALSKAESEAKLNLFYLMNNAMENGQLASTTDDPISGKLSKNAASILSIITLFFLFIAICLILPDSTFHICIFFSLCESR